MAWTFLLLIAGAFWLLLLMVFGGMAVIKSRDDKWVISSDGVRWDDSTFVSLRDIARVQWPHSIDSRTGQARFVARSDDPKRIRTILRDLVGRAER